MFVNIFPVKLMCISRLEPELTFPFAVLILALLIDLDTFCRVFEKSLQYVKRFSRYKNPDAVRQVREYPRNDRCVVAFGFILLHALRVHMHFLRRFLCGS